MRRGFTLFEVLIALLMMSILLGSVGFALRSNLLLLDAARTETAEAQLARALLEKMARDLRNAVVAIKQETIEVDIESIQAAFLSSSSTNLIGLDTSLLATMTGSTGDVSASTGDETGSESENDQELTGLIPGIYGELEWVQIDTARLPRGEMFGGKVSRSGVSPLADRLSPSKTVLYYLGKDTGTESGLTAFGANAALGSLGRSLNRNAPQIGLYRRELDRLATQYMIDQGEETEREPYDDLLAPEVERIEFQYFDPEAGQEGDVGDWVESWDMDEIGYLPKAIRITVWIRRMGEDQGNRALSGDSLTGQTTAIRTIPYSLIVVLPITIETESESTQSDQTSAE